MNTAENDLIFERYTQTKINESYETSIAGRFKELLQTNAAAIQKAGIYADLDAIQNDISQVRNTDFAADVSEAHQRLQLLLIQRKADMEDLGLLEPLQSLANEMMDIMKDDEHRKRTTAKYEDNESSEGAVNLLEQLKAEVPELEDKINRVLEKVFDAVDILKQESYADDPQLQKVYASLIEGDF